MSTRCMIEVEGNNVKLYRHSDGYPDGKWGVLATLLPQVRKFLKVRSWNPGYLLARIAQWQMNDQDKHSEDSNYNTEETTCIGFGLDTQYHFDLEYVYRVCEKGTIEVWETENGERTKLLNTINIRTGKPEKETK